MKWVNGSDNDGVFPWASVGTGLGRVARMISSRIPASRPRRVSRFVGQTISEEDICQLREWMRCPQDWYVPRAVRSYEDAFARFHGTSQACAFSAGRVALAAILEASHHRPGDEVIVPGYTCVAVTNAIRLVGAVPVFADIELDTFGLDAEAFRHALTRRTKSVVVHHLYGLVSRDIERVLELARAARVTVIEDCSHALGARFDNRLVGTLGDASFFSTEQSKVMSTGRGGVAIACDREIASGLSHFRDCAPALPPSELRQILAAIQWAWHRNQCNAGFRTRMRAAYHGQRRFQTCEHEETKMRPFASYGFRLPAILAALGERQLAKLDDLNAIRRESAEHWAQWAECAGYKPPIVRPGSTPVFLRYPVLVERHRKAEREWAFRELGLDVGVWFTSNIHPLSRWIPGCPRGREAAERCINLPTLPST